MLSQLTEGDTTLVVIIGSNGQLGVELCKACAKLSLGYYALSHSNIRVEDSTSVNNCLNDLTCKPDVVINTAAFHDVAACELQPLRAYDVNADGSANVARWCRDNGAKAVYISTDYCGSYMPLSVYAKTKLAGEMAPLSICPDGLVVRLGTLYGASGCRAKGGGNFIDTVVTKLMADESFTLPDYTSIRPTSAKLAAQKILRNIHWTGVAYANDVVPSQSHYALGCWLAEVLKVGNHIKAISHDPDDRIRPHKIEYVSGGFPCIDFNEDGLYDYLTEKGYLK